MQMMRTLVLGILTVVLVGGFALAEDKAAKPQTNCPVMGGKVKKEIYVDHEGNRVYLCCKGCISKFKEDPAKYIKKLEDAGVTVEKAGKPQTNCPVMGGKVNKEIYVDHKGNRVYFCCKGCVSKFKEDPEKYIKKLEGEGITLEKTPEAAGESKASAEGSSEGGSGCGTRATSTPKQGGGGGGCK